MSATGWCFTSFKQGGWEVLPPKSTYLIYQLEKCPTTGRLHWQGYIEMASKSRMPAVKKALGDLGAHLEPRRGTPSEASDYCKKSNTRIHGPYEFGELRADPGKRHDLASACAIVRDRGFYALYAEGYHDAIIAQYRGGLKELHVLRNMKFAFEARDVIATAIIGPSGVGKTHWAYEKYGFRNVYCLPECNNAIPWFDQYDGQDVLLIDEMEKNKIAYTMLLKILDKWPLKLQIKGAIENAGWTKVILTSNHHPSTWYDWAVHDRDALYRRLGGAYLHITERGEFEMKDLSHFGGGVILAKADPPLSIPPVLCDL